MAQVRVQLSVRDMVEAKLLMYELVELLEWMREREKTVDPWESMGSLVESRQRLERALMRFGVREREAGLS